MKQRLQLETNFQDVTGLEYVMLQDLKFILRNQKNLSKGQILQRISCMYEVTKQYLN